MYYSALEMCLHSRGEATACLHQTPPQRLPVNVPDLLLKPISFALSPELNKPTRAFVLLGHIDSVVGPLEPSIAAIIYHAPQLLLVLASCFALPITFSVK